MFFSPPRLTFKLLALDSVTDVYMDNSYEDTPQDPLDLVDRYEDLERSLNAEFQLELEPMDGHALVLGVSRSAGTWELDGSERYSDYPDWTRYSKSSDSRVEALFAQDEIDLGEQVILTLGGVMIVIGLTLSRWREPTSLMYRGGSRWLNNEDLKPERSNSWEVGLNFGAPSGVVSGTLAFYRTDYKDRIASVYVTEEGQPCNDFPCSRQYQNIAAIRVEGVELTLNGKLAERWRPFFNYTLSAAEIRDNQADPESEGNSPAYTPRHKINLGASYVDDQQGVTARVAGRYVSTRYWSERHYEWTKLDNFFVVDTKLSQSFSISDSMPEIELSLVVNNLFDEEYMEWRNELADGRNWWLEVAANFH
jgi:outer membrane receptor protein involved in Fe transport